MLQRVAFVTAIPLNVAGGSGCYVGISTLARAMERHGVQVDWITPKFHLPVYAAGRVLFNESLRRRNFSAYDAVIGFDLDGYTLAPKTRHIANIKGVLGDAVPFESGPTRLSLALQARLEAAHVRRADCVITISQYCATRIRELYNCEKPIAIVPELIDLSQWRGLFRQAGDPKSDNRFRVLCVCRFYRRKRVDVLLRAAALVWSKIPELEVRIVGGGPDASALRKLGTELGLDPIVRWLGDVKQADLACEYSNASLFCLPSAQEGFGIVLLEAMAAGKAILATRSAAVPEVAPHGVLVEPNNPDALAQGLLRLYRDSSLRAAIAAQGLRLVEQYDCGKVARQFMDVIETGGMKHSTSTNV